MLNAELNILAASDVLAWAALIVSILSFVIGTWVTITLWKMSHFLRQIELREQRDQNVIETTKKELHEANVKLVDDRFRAFTHEINNHVNAFKLTLEMLKSDLQDADGTIGNLGDRDQKIELSFASKIDGLKDYIREENASKSDLQRHEQAVSQKFDKMNERIGALAEKVAVLSDRGDRK